MAEHPAADEPKKSVFEQVDQRQMIRRLVEAAPDEVETSFFDAALARPHDAATDRIVAGIEALSGTAVTVPPTVVVAHPVPDAAAVEPVAVEGAIGDDEAALRSFLLHGPAGVVRSPQRPSAAGGRG